jgi:hypothetical protein
MKSMIKNATPATKFISSGAERMRRHRQRRREGLRSLRIELRETEVDMLVRSGYLQRDRRNDASAVTHALYRVFDRIFRVTRNVTT